MNKTCNICGKPKLHPYRIYDNFGKVIEGCVDDFHTGELITPSESAFWHNRKDAKLIRKLSKTVKLK